MQPNFASALSYRAVKIRDRRPRNCNRCPKYPKFYRLSKNAYAFDYCNTTRKRNSPLKRCLIYLAKLSVARKITYRSLLPRHVPLMNLRREKQTSSRTSLMLLCHFTKMERSREMKSMFSFATLAE